jgi:hypothetical protein
MSPEVIVSSLARLNELLQKKFEEHKAKQKKFKQMQMILVILSFSITLVLFVIYNASFLQMLFILVGFNALFFVGFKPRTPYREKWVKAKMQKIVLLQVALKKFIMEEEASFDGVKCQIDEGWIADKWGFHKDNERVDYGAFLYDKHIKGLYLEALRNKK